MKKETPVNSQDYQITDNGDHRVFHYAGRSYQTHYSRAMIEHFIQWKGPQKAPGFLASKDVRTAILKPLCAYLAKNGSKDLKVLEVGCSRGQVTEFLQEQPFVGEIYAFDVSQSYVDLAKWKCDELGLDKVVQVDCFTSEETRNLPYPDEFFDLIIVNAVVEHLPLENRYEYVDGYYKRLKRYGLICFFETPNRHFPMETHTIGLPLVNRFSPQAAYIYTRIFGKRKDWAYADFMRVGTGWKSAAYHECLPRTMSMKIQDISAEAGYGYRYAVQNVHPLRKAAYWFLNLWARGIGFPIEFYLPYLNLVFKRLV